MVEIGGRPILWHIMKLYSHYGVNDFVICAGYKGYLIKEYFANYWLHMSDVTFDMCSGSDQVEVEIHNQRAEPWKVTIVDTGELSQTGGRLRRVRDHIGEDTFCFTYGDGLGNVDIRELVAFHKQMGKMATLTAVSPPGRYGALDLDGQGGVSSFKEKPAGDGGLINGGFFVVEPSAIELIGGDETSWESVVLEEMAKQGQLAAFEHSGFWQPMDTLRDKNYLDKLWDSNAAPWKLWK